MKKLLMALLIATAFTPLPTTKVSAACLPGLSCLFGKAGCSKSCFKKCVKETGIILEVAGEVETIPQFIAEYIERHVKDIADYLGHNHLIELLELSDPNHERSNLSNDKLFKKLVKSDLIDVDGNITPFYDDNGQEIASANAVKTLITLMAGETSKGKLQRRQSTPMPIQRGKEYTETMDVDNEEKEIEEAAQQLLSETNNNQNQKYIYNNNKKVYGLTDLHNHRKIAKTTDDKKHLKKSTKKKRSKRSRG